MLRVLVWPLWMGSWSVGELLVRRRANPLFRRVLVEWERGGACGGVHRLNVGDVGH